MSRIIGIGYFKGRVRRKRKLVEDRRAMRKVDSVVINQDDILKLELETLYMIGAPAS